MGIFRAERADEVSGADHATFSPNAAYAQAIVPLTAGIPYVFKARWKTNYATGATIRAGAGLGPQFSPTRLSLRFFTGGTALQATSSTQQQVLSASTEPLPVDDLLLYITPAANSLYVISANADLWTDTPGVNQDLGINVIDLPTPTGGVSIGWMSWKESGGFSGTFSPNAAFIQNVVSLTAGHNYAVHLEMKANKASSGHIYAGAGSGPQFSPTWLIAQVMN